MSDKTTTLAELANTDLVLQSELATLFQNSLTTNGYQKLPGGLIIQWITGLASTAGETTTALTFPIEFPNMCLFAISNTLNSSASPAADTNYQIASFTSTTVNVYRQQNPGNSISTAPLVFAIGY